MDAIKEELTEFVSRMQLAAGANLEAIVLYGSAARDDFREGHSDLNLLCLLRTIDARTLDILATVVDWWTRTLGHRPPQVLTVDELRMSADVFAIETLDIKDCHRLLAGRDVLGEIEVPMNLHRVQLEHELRTFVLKLRQHYLLFAGNQKELEKALAKSVSSASVLLRHVLIAAGIQPPPSKREVALHVAEMLGVDAGPLAAALDAREGRRLESEVNQLYCRYMEFVSSVVAAVDKLAPKRQWQRVAAPPERNR